MHKCLKAEALIDLVFQILHYQAQPKPELSWAGLALFSVKRATLSHTGIVLKELQISYTCFIWRKTSMEDDPNRKQPQWEREEYLYGKVS